MTDHFLSLNSEKTKIMLVRSPHQLRKAEAVTVTPDGSNVEFQTKSRNLEVHFDVNLSLEILLKFHSSSILEILPDCVQCCHSLLLRD